MQLDGLYCELSTRAGNELLFLELDGDYLRKRKEEDALACGLSANPRNFRASQRFKLQAHPSVPDAYTVFNLFNRAYLALGEDGDALRFVSADDLDAETTAWHIEDVGENAVVLLSHVGSKALAINNTNKKGSNKVFVECIDKDPSVFTIENDISCKFSSISRYIGWSLSAKLVVAPAENALEPQTPLVLETILPINSDDRQVQKWSFNRLQSGYYAIQNSLTKLYLTAWGKEVRILDESPDFLSQRWSVFRNDDGTYSIKSALSCRELGVSGFTIVQGSPIALFDKADGYNFKFDLYS